MNIKQEFTTVTPLSKIIAASLFIALPFVGFYFGMQFSDTINSTILYSYPSSDNESGSLEMEIPDQQKSVACTQEAKICSDGTSVGRVGPKCEFAACPAEIKKTDKQE